MSEISGIASRETERAEVSVSVALIRSLTPRQITMLRDYERDNEASDFADFYSAGTLAWRNRERVIEALWSKGLLNEDGITEIGRHVLSQIKMAGQS